MFHILVVCRIRLNSVRDLLKSHAPNVLLLLLLLLQKNSN